MTARANGCGARLEGRLIGDLDGRAESRRRPAERAGDRRKSVLLAAQDATPRDVGPRAT